MSKQPKIVIIGGGLIGAACALALAKQGMAVILVDRGDPARSQDRRSLVLGYHSCQYLEGLGVPVNDLGTPVERVAITQAERFGNLLFDVNDLFDDPDTAYLGRVIVGNNLSQQLAGLVQKNSFIECCFNTQVTQCRYVEQGIAVTMLKNHVNSVNDSVNSSVMNADLLLIADGAQSKARDQLGFSVVETNYDQQALVADVRVASLHGNGHNNTAIERMTKEGALALLPRDEDKMGLVFSLQGELATIYQKMSPRRLLVKLQQALGDRLRLLEVSVPVVFDLVAVTAQTLVAPHAVLLGNAAQTLHPISAQGFNLGLRDVKAFAGWLNVNQEIYPNYLKKPDFNGMSSAECKSKSFPNSGAIAQSFKSDFAQAHDVKTSASSSDLGMALDFSRLQTLLPYESLRQQDRDHMMQLVTQLAKFSVEKSQASVFSGVGLSILGQFEGIKKSMAKRAMGFM